MSTLDRYIAFKKADHYYVFNDSKTGLKMIGNNKDYLLWNDASILETLSAEQIVKVSGYELVIHSNTDKNYKVQCIAYQTTTTTDYTHFVLTGFSSIINMKFVATETAHVLLSFDNRKTWKYYDKSTNKWVDSDLEKIYFKSNTVSEINSFTQNIFSLLFTKNCTLDYAIALTSAETLTSVSLSLPINTAPIFTKASITTLGMSGSEPITHKESIAVHVEVDDLDGDQLSYKFHLDYPNPNEYVDGNYVPGRDYLLEEGIIDKNSNGKLDLLCNSDHWTVARHAVYVTITDTKGYSKRIYFYLTRVNQKISCSAVVNKDILSFSINDKENDKTRYQIFLNGELIQDYQDFEETPCNKSIQLPLEKIKFGEKNHIRINYQEDIFQNLENDDTSTYYFDLDFIGEYYGVLFIDISNSDPDENNRPNKYHYYSDSIGEVIKKLTIPPIVQGYRSQAFEIGCFNNSNKDFKYVSIKSMYNIKDQMALLVSSKNPFDENEGMVEFYNLKVGETRNFYVKLVSYDGTGTVDDSKAIIAEASKQNS